MSTFIQHYRGFDIHYKHGQYTTLQRAFAAFTIDGIRWEIDMHLDCQE